MVMLGEAMDLLAMVMCVTVAGTRFDEGVVRSVRPG